jgi:Uma2 family endonuclease
MATATLTPETTPAVAPISAPALLGDQCVEMHEIGWVGYETMLRLRGDASKPKMIYLDGDLILVSPALARERMNERIGFFLDQLILGLRLPCLRSGQTTFRRRRKRGGVEGDRTYYIANEPQVRGKMKIDLRIDPPPDLAIEVINTHKADSALKVYRRLGVPEVWVCEEGSLDFLLRQANGQYSRSPNSLAFPFLNSAELLNWMDRPYSGPDVDWMEEVHRWVFDVIVPRVRGAGAERQGEVQGPAAGPIGREDAIVLGTRLVEKRRHARKVSLRSIREEARRWELRFDIELPPGRDRPPDFAIVHVYKKTGVTREFSHR